MLEDISALHKVTVRKSRNMDTATDANSLSSLESESDLSLAFERDISEISDSDELPAFEIRALSPHGRTPSPIDDLNISDIETPKQLTPKRSPGHQNNPEFVALHEINAQIAAPQEGAGEPAAVLSRTNSLETIFEGVFLHTPTREKLNNSAGSNPNSASRFTPKRIRVNLMEMIAINRLQAGGKENCSPHKDRQDEFT